MIWFQYCLLIAAVDLLYCGGETAFWKTHQNANIIYKIMHVVFVIFLMFFFLVNSTLLIITLNIFQPICVIILIEICQQREKRICKVGLSLPSHLFFYNWSHCSLRQTDGLNYSPAWNRISPQLILALKSDCIMLYLNLQKVFFSSFFLPIPYFFPPCLLSLPVFIQPYLPFSAPEFTPSCGLILFPIHRPSPGSWAGKDSVGEE